jgi:GT2 family glycosyltransferase
MQILAIVVRYKTSLEDSATIRSLSAEYHLCPELLRDLGVIVWDNSPQPLSFQEAPTWFEYQHSRENKGVSGAYNGALARAESLGCPWLLMLDQDTELPPGYLLRMLHYSRTVAEDTRIAAVVPFIQSNGNIISPRRFGRTLRTSLIKEKESGNIEGYCYAANSGTLMRVSALRAVGGYSELFWLDFSDQYVFHLLHVAGFVMYLAADLRVPHSLASSDYNRGMSPERYENFLAAENLFSRMFRSRLMNGAHNLLLLARAVRQYRRLHNKDFAKLTLSSLWQRLSLSRNRSIELWTKDLGKRGMPLISEGKTVG